MNNQKPHAGPKSIRAIADEAREALNMTYAEVFASVRRRLEICVSEGDEIAKGLLDRLDAVRDQRQLLQEGLAGHDIGVFRLRCDELSAELKNIQRETDESFPWVDSSEVN